MAGDPVADYPSVTIDDSQQLHLVWTGLHNIYYSQAAAVDAYNAAAWQSPVVISENSARSRFESSVAVDGEGIIHVAYAGQGDELGVFYRRSLDGGNRWEAPRLLSNPLRASEDSYSSVQIVVDRQGIIHMVWQTSDSEGYGRGIYYRRSLEQGVSWQPAVTMQFTEQSGAFAGWPYLFVASGGQLHLVYAREENKGRAYRLSADNGQSWTDEAVILTEMEGINGYVFPLEDAAGQLYLIVNMRPMATQETGLYYTSYDGERWPAASPLAIGEPYGPSAHYAAGVVQAGNEIHVVWTDLGGGEIWYVGGRVTNAPAIAAIPVPSPTAAGGTATPTVQPALAAGGEQAAGAGIPTFDQTMPAGNSFRLAPLLFSVAAALLILIPVALWRQLHH
jgi:hypothetical protein